MAAVKFGTPGLNMPPPEANTEVCKTYEQAGLDFLVWFDQLNLTIPRSIWQPDLVPGATLWDIDAWLEPWPMLTAAALATERIELGLVASDTMRRAPAVLAQLALTIDHFAHGRFFLTLGAGERKQFEPYGLPRERPFAHLEEALKIVRLLWEHNEPVDYKGPIWNLDRAILALPPFEGKPPKLLVAGGPGKALKFAGQLADGWVSYWPAVGTVEDYAQQVRQLKRSAEEAGRDPDDVTVFLAFPSVIGPNDAAVTEATENAALRWDAAAMLADTSCWTRAGMKNPLGDDWSYSRDLIPMWWTREDALKIVEQVPPEAVRATRVTGTPAEAAAQIAPFIEAGATHVLVANYLPLIMSGDFSDALQGTSQSLETIEILRQR
ncbi:MAG TPA: LLM class flavin-dependent oxidoreductase [Acidimicrobiia bacterium]|nr:LLM class flavin-dependent oxidoreductase [Acidimicrobiia bacterium]